MPPADLIVDDGKFLVRLAIYGVDKTRKTWWLMRAAELGFNVIVLDGDDGYHIIKNITDPTVRARIKIIQAQDKLDRPVFNQLMARLCKGEAFCWDETNGQVRVMRDACKPDAGHWWINTSKLNKYDMLGVDSWSALSQSTHKKTANSLLIDLTDMSEDDRKEKGRAMFGQDGQFLSFFLQQMKGFPCHLAVIGHEEHYTKFAKDQKTEIFTRMQMKSSSGPHGLTLGAFFSDILYFYKVGEKVKISTEPKEGRLGGARLVPPMVKFWEELQFKDICGYASIPIPGPDAPQTEAFRYYAPGQAVEELPASTLSPRKEAVNTSGSDNTISLPNSGAKTGLGALFAASKAKKEQQS